MDVKPLVPDVAASLIPSVDVHSGLDFLCQVTEVDKMYGKLSPEAFYTQSIEVLDGLISGANRQGLADVVKNHLARRAFAKSMLEIEVARPKIPTSEMDAEPKMVYRDGHAFVVAGDPSNGGYSIELNERGENRFVRN